MMNAKEAIIIVLKVFYLRGLR